MLTLLAWGRGACAVIGERSGLKIGAGCLAALGGDSACPLPGEPCAGDISLVFGNSGGAGVILRPQSRLYPIPGALLLAPFLEAPTKPQKVVPWAVGDAVLEGRLIYHEGTFYS